MTDLTSEEEREIALLAESLRRMQKEVPHPTAAMLGETNQLLRQVVALLNPETNAARMKLMEREVQNALWLNQMARIDELSTIADRFSQNAGAAVAELANGAFSK